VWHPVIAQSLLLAGWRLAGAPARPRLTNIFTTLVCWWQGVGTKVGTSPISSGSVVGGSGISGGGHTQRAPVVIKPEDDEEVCSPHHTTHVQPHPFHIAAETRM
jgi:hypothetical protein